MIELTKAPFRRLAPAADVQLETATDTFGGIFSNEQVARDGHIVRNAGIRYANYMADPVMLWAHDDKRLPVAKATRIDTSGQDCRLWWRFVPREIDPFAGMVRDLVAGKWIRALSMSWMPLEGKPLPDGGFDFTEVDLLEVSFVPIPALPSALIDARSHGVDTRPMFEWAERLLDTGADGGMILVPRVELETLRRAAKMPEPEKRAAAEWKVGAAKDLLVEDSDSWDGSAAEKSIFEHAGGDDFDPAKARKGFLVYNAAEPEKRGSYKLPIAHVVDGELKVPKGAIRAAASRLPQTDIPDDVKKRAESVLEHYKEKAGIGKDGDGETKEDRSMNPTPKARKLKFRRGLYECAQLAYVLMSLCGMHDQSVWEEEMEEDGESDLPQMLGALLKDASEAFLAMSKEEVEELLEHVDETHSEEEIPKGERAYVAGAKNPRIRAWRRGIACLRAGKALSTSNAKKLEEAQAHHERAAKHHRALGDHHKDIGDHVEEARAAHERATGTLSELGYDHHEVTRAMEDMHEHLEKLGESHGDAVDTHSLLGRCMRSAHRAVQSVLESKTPTDPEAADGKEDRAARLLRAKALRGDSLN